MTGNDAARTRFLWQTAMVVLLAWLLREQFVLFTQVDAPIRGDARQYVAYAWNLVHHGVFSMAAPGSSVVVPDDFRSPGYPLLLAAAIRIGGEAAGWYAIVLHLQALLGAATVALGMALGSHWLSRRWTLVAGVLMALWPHSIAACGAVLSEVLFGFLLALALWAGAGALRRRSSRWVLFAGLAFALAYLVNPVMLLFPPVAALVFVRAGQGRSALLLLLLPALIAGAWALRSASLPATPDHPGRAVLNFVEGSWPQYQAAYNFKDIDPTAAQISGQIADEEQLFGRSPRQGLAAMIERMDQDPAYYVRWYLFRKPWLLWDWNIRIGWGDVYYQQIQHSPLDVNPPLRAMKTTLHLLNPLVFALAVAAAFVSLARVARRSRATDPALTAAAMVALFCVYVTFLHTVFQAEPRYSIPYRPFELLLAVTAAAAIVARARARLSSTRTSPGAAASP